MTSSITQKINSIAREIPDRVKLIVITKYAEVEAMRQAYAAGARDFGENRLQDALDKQQQLQDLPGINWHFIGHIQKNKAKKVVENFDWIHSVDSLALAQRLNRLATEIDKTLPVLLQVKILPDPDKYGWQVEPLWQDLAQLSKCDRLSIQGLMVILPLGLSSDQTLKAFQATKTLSQSIKQEYPHLPMQELSMGMSGDYSLAIAAGATMIRLGRTIFN